MMSWQSGGQKPAQQAGAGECEARGINEYFWSELGRYVAQCINAICSPIPFKQLMTVSPTGQCSSWLSKITLWCRLVVCTVLRLNHQTSTSYKYLFQLNVIIVTLICLSVLDLRGSIELKNRKIMSFVLVFNHFYDFRSVAERNHWNTYVVIWIFLLLLWLYHIVNQRWTGVRAKGNRSWLDLNLE